MKNLSKLSMLLLASSFLVAMPSCGGTDPGKSEKKPDPNTPLTIVPKPGDTQEVAKPKEAPILALEVVTDYCIGNEKGYFAKDHNPKSPYMFTWGDAIKKFSKISYGGVFYHLPSHWEAQAIFGKPDSRLGISFEWEYKETIPDVEKTEEAQLPGEEVKEYKTQYFYTEYEKKGVKPNKIGVIPRNVVTYALRYIPTDGSPAKHFSAFRYRYISTLREKYVQIDQIWLGADKVGKVTEKELRDLEFWRNVHVMRIFPLCGESNKTGGNHAQIGTEGWFWTSTPSTYQNQPTQAYSISIARDAAAVDVMSKGREEACAVRLFRTVEKGK